MFKETIEVYKLNTGLIFQKEEVIFVGLTWEGYSYTSCWLLRLHASYILLRILQFVGILWLAWM